MIKAKHTHSKIKRELEIMKELRLEGSIKERSDLKKLIKTKEEQDEELRLLKNDEKVKRYLSLIDSNNDFENSISKIIVDNQYNCNHIYVEVDSTKDCYESCTYIDAICIKCGDKTHQRDKEYKRLITPISNMIVDKQNTKQKLVFKTKIEMVKIIKDKYIKLIKANLDEEKIIETLKEDF